ncbi:MAG: TauD/TfdA family dioxygenase [Spirochaetaceae bacterium]|nr:TauD/TfdA family dioxygenase [Myxococcales bacterium]MCB9723314.1 TauD/TfdA family dioxygenase [Spirochaetaceae bacterium]
MAMALRAADMEVRRLSGSLGAEVRGIRLASADASDAAAIRSLLLEHLVLFFPDQHLSPDEHIAFGRHFGELESHPNLSLDAERPQFFELRATGGSGAIADEWHSDLTCEAEPSVFAILQMKKCPAVGGDTLWANMYKAYDELSQPMKDLCEGLSALHDASSHGTPERKAIHPVVRVHPETGRKSLFVNHHFTRRIVETSHEESEVLLGFLTRWVTGTRFTVRYHWTEGTIAVWDNRCTQHHVLNDFEGERVIQRVTVMGDRPQPAAPPRYAPFGGKFSAASWRDEPLRRFLRDRETRS